MNETLEVRDTRRAPFYWIERTLLERYGAELKPFGLAVYNALAYHANAETAECWPSFQTIADLVGCSRRQVIRELQKLECLGLVQVERRDYRSSVYTLLSVVTDSHHSGDSSSDSQSPGSDSQSPGSDCESPEQESRTRIKNNEGGAVVFDELVSFGVDPAVAHSLAPICAPDRVTAWIDYARSRRGLTDPAAYLVSRLRKGGSPPKPKRRRDYKEDGAGYREGGDYTDVCSCGRVLAKGATCPSCNGPQREDANGKGETA